MKLFSAPRFPDRQLRQVLSVAQFLGAPPARVSGVFHMLPDGSALTIAGNMARNGHPDYIAVEARHSD